MASRVKPALLALADGRVFRGEALGAAGEADGEVVFNTSMTGYQEILTDPSYRGQIVTMTCPEIGNYGVNDFDQESRRPQVEGFVVREISEIHSSWRSRKDLPQYLKENNVIGISEVDTRAITRRTRRARRRENTIIRHSGSWGWRRPCHSCWIGSCVPGSWTFAPRWRG